MEIWKEVLGFNGNYLISNYGNFWSCVRESWNGRKWHKIGGVHLVIKDNGNGYKKALLWLEGKQINVYSHRAVAEAFIDNPDNLPQVGHRDDDKSNNYVENLYWCSGSTNIKDAHKTGRMTKRSTAGPVEAYPADSVVCAYKEAVYGGCSITKTATKYGMPRTTLSSIVNKKSRWEITDKIDKEILGGGEIIK